MSEGSHSIRAVRRVCDIIDLVQTRPQGLTLQEVADATGLPKSSAFRYLYTLEECGYVERTPSGDFTVGLALRSERLDVLSQRIQPYLAKLRDEVGETVNLGLLDNGRIVYVEIAESRKAVRNAPHPGDRAPIHSTALGKVLVAWTAEDVVLGLLDRYGMPPLTPKTIISPKKYLAELAQVRKQGYAVDDGEDGPDGRCVAVPLRGTRLPLAVSISAPASRLPIKDVPAAAAALQRMANEFQGTADVDESGRTH
jgi:IclR family acetate operon transcriptional repressor